MTGPAEPPDRSDDESGQATRRLLRLTATITGTGLLAILIGFLKEVAANAVANLIPGQPGWILVGAVLVVVVAAVLLIFPIRYRARAGRRVKRSGAPGPAVPGPRIAPDVPQAMHVAEGLLSIRHRPPVTELFPPDIRDFVGRDGELARIEELTESEPVMAIVGPATAGTSTLAIHAAYRLCERRGGIGVYVNLVGEQGQPLTRDQALRVARIKAGLPGLSLRAREEEHVRAAVDLREWIADQRVVLVLDNVAEVDQVSDLLPAASRQGRVLVAGGAGLGQLGVGGRVEVPPLTVDDGLALLEHSSGLSFPEGRERQAAGELVGMFGQNPDAVRMLGRLLVTWNCSAEEGLERARRGTHDPELDPVWQASNLGYARMDPACQDLVRLLARIPTVPLSVPAVAALAGTAESQASRLLGELNTLGFLDPAWTRYTLAARLRVAAGRLARGGEPQDTVTALGRLAGYFAEQAAEVPDPRVEDPTGRAVAWYVDTEPAVYELVTHWLDAPDRELLSRPHQADLFTLAKSLSGWYALRPFDPDDWYGPLERWRAVARTVLALPGTAPRGTPAGWAYNQLGVAARLAGEPAGAVQAYERAAATRRWWSPTGAAQLATNRGLAELDAGDVESALRHLHRGVSLRPSGDLPGRSAAELALGAAYLRLGEPDRADEHLDRADHLFSALREPAGQAAVYANRALVYASRAHWIAAQRGTADATRRYDRLGDPVGAARASWNAAAIALARDPGAGWNPAEDGPPDPLSAGLVEVQLGDAAYRTGRYEAARTHWRTALSLLGAAPEAYPLLRRLRESEPRR